MFDKLTAIISSAIVVVFGFFGGNSNKNTVPQQPAQSQISIYKVELFNAVNDYREESKLTRIILDDQACKIADRIIEKYWWSTDINLPNYSDLCPECNSLSINQAQDMSDVTSILSSWKANSKTNEILKSSSAYGCVEIIDQKIVLVLVNKNSAKTTANVASTQTTTTTTTGPSRTGVIIKYHEWCSQKDINVYQNELITKKSSDGKTYSMTQGDWNCYEKFLSNKTNTTTVTNNNNTNPPCTIYYSALGFSQTFYSFSPEECLKYKNEAVNPKTNLITCIVSYPCNGTSNTYQVDQNICNLMQSGAESTCSTYDAIKKMQDIGSKTYDYPQAKPIDGTIHVDPTPTCRLTPYGCY